MTNAEWLACANPAALFHDVIAGASSRELRLFLCACLREVPLDDGRTPWQAFDQSFRDAVVTAEQFADGVASAEELARAAEVAASWEYRAEGATFSAPYTFAAEAYDDPSEWSPAAAQRTWHRPRRDYHDQHGSVLRHQATVHLIHATSADVGPGVAWHFMAEWPHYQQLTPARAIWAGLVLDIFRRTGPIAAAWLRWNHGTVPAIAKHIYDDRAFHDLPILADALMDAGCDNQAILDHCRSPGPRVRGCWVIDLLLGRR